MKMLRFTFLAVLLLPAIALAQGDVEPSLKTDAQGNLLRPLNLGGPNVVGVLKDPRIVSAYTDTQTLFVDQATGVDNAANRGTRAPFATLNAAIAAAQQGDTINLSVGTYTLSATPANMPGVHIQGAGKDVTIINPSGTTRLLITSAFSIDGVSFGAPGATATTNVAGGSGLIYLGSGATGKITNVNFNGYNGVCVFGAGNVHDLTVEKCTFANCFQPVYIDSTSYSSVPGNLVFTDDVATGALNSGFQVHCKDGDRQYTGTNPPYAVIPGASINGRQAPGLSSGLWFTRCSSTLASGDVQLAFEVWHGWQNVHFSHCYANGQNGYGISCAYCYYVFLDDTEMQASGFGVECADSVEMHATNCHLVNSSATVDGASHACSWEGGDMYDSGFILNGAGAGSETVGGWGFTLEGADLAATGLQILHFSDVQILNNRFRPADDGDVASNFIQVYNQPSGALDFGGQTPSTSTFTPFVLQGVNIRGNKFEGPCSSSIAIVGVSAGSYGSNSMNGLIVDGNETDPTAATDFGGQFFNLQGMVSTNQHITNNRTVVTPGSQGIYAAYPQNLGFINDGPDGQKVVQQTGSYTPSNADRGSTQVFTASSASTVTLPAPSTPANYPQVWQFANGWKQTLYNAGTSTVTITAANGTAINGSAPAPLIPGSSYDVISDGVDWDVLPGGSANSVAAEASRAEGVEATKAPSAAPTFTSLATLQAASGPEFLMSATGNGTNLKNWFWVIDSYGNYALNALNDQQNSLMGTFYVSHTTGIATFFQGTTHSAITYANRDPSPAAGTQQMFSDSTTQTWGATISGGGSLPALGLFDGANWTVMGK